MNQDMKRLISLVLGIASLPLYSNIDAAELEEIVVTATRREERLQDVPIAVSAMSGDSLNKAGAKELADYYLYVPSMNAAHNMVGERGGQNIIIRGISNSRVISTNDSSMLSATTGFYLNDIPITPVDTQLFDVDRVEILRGPQGTLYGAGSMGGAVKLFNNRANVNEFDAVVEGTASGMASGGFAGDINGMVNIPILEGVLGARIVGSYRARDGFIDTVMIPLTNPVPNTTYPWSSTIDVGLSESSKRIIKDANSAKTTGARLAVLYTPTESLLVEAAVLWQSTRSDDLTVYNTHYTRPLLQEKFLLEPTSSEMTLSSLEISYDFGAVTLTSNTGLYTRDYDETVDYTLILKGTRAPALSYVPAAGALETLSTWNTFTQEVRLQSDDSDSGDSLFSRMHWVVGAFWMEEDREPRQTASAPGWRAAAPNNPLRMPNDFDQAADGDVEDTSKALFVDASFDLTDKLVVGAGIRYFELTTKFYGTSLPGVPATPAVPIVSDRSYDEDGHTPRYFVQYKQSEDLMFYGSYAEGFRLGGATTPINFATSPQCLPVVIDNNLEQFSGGEFFSDSVETTEIGVKTGLLDGRLSANVSAYRTDWSDLQQQIRLTGFPGSLCTAVLTGNVGTAQVDGYELEISALATDQLILSGTVSYTDARIIDPGAGVAVAKAGDAFPNVPEWSGSLMADYTIPTKAFGGSDFFLHGDLRYISETSPVLGTPPNPLSVLPAYTLVGLRAGFTFGENPLTITLFVNNVFDEDAHLNSRGRVGVASDIIVTPAIPRTVGLTMRKDF
jgi:outer membrane receptor protein involved in Fe transport